MQKLVCDVCGGNIQIQAGGKEGVCEYCGATYTMDRLREILSGVKVSQTGSAEDVEQWRELAKKYYAASSFGDAENIVKKILEASPRDEEANHMYEELQDLKYFDVRNGSIVSYSGRARKVTIPPIASKEVNLSIFSKDDINTSIEELVISEGIERIINIGVSKFEGTCRLPNLTSITLPATLTEIGQAAFKGSGLKSIIVPNSVKKIGAQAFFDCKALTKVTLPNYLAEIEPALFAGCCSLQNIELPPSLKAIGFSAFVECSSLVEMIIPEGVKTIGFSAFVNCKNLRKLVIPDSVDSILIKDEDGQRQPSVCAGCERLSDIVYPSRFDVHLFEDTPFYMNSATVRNQKIAAGRCPYCNVPLKGVFNKYCPYCNRRF